LKGVEAECRGGEKRGNLYIVLILPHLSPQVAVTFNGQHVELVLTRFANLVFIVITTNNKLGTLVSEREKERERGRRVHTHSQNIHTHIPQLHASPDGPPDAPNQTFTISCKFGQRNEVERRERERECVCVCVYVWVGVGVCMYAFV